MSIYRNSDVPIGALVATSVSAPWWRQFVKTATEIDALLLMVGGLVLLSLTIWSKVMEIRIKRRHLRDMDKPE